LRSSPQNLWVKRALLSLKWTWEFLGYSLISFGVFGAIHWFHLEFLWWCVKCSCWNLATTWCNLYNLEGIYNHWNWKETLKEIGETQVT
jgi:hypothetical protein